jgi:septal ring-binding cell division protein DamX
MPKPIDNHNRVGWFCQVNEAGDNWDCVQSPRGLKSPIPTRFTKPLQPEPVLTATPLSRDNSDSSILDPLQLPMDLTDANLTETEVLTTAPAPPSGDGDEPAADASSAPPQVAADDPHAPVAAIPPRSALARERNPPSAKQPDWQRLAYRPAVPVALDELPAHFYAVQIVALSSRESLESFSKKHLLSGVSAVRVESNGAFYYVLLLGIYETLADAQAAAASRPESLINLEPWIRVLESLQDAAVRADKLAGSTDF